MWMKLPNGHRNRTPLSLAQSIYSNTFSYAEATHAIKAELCTNNWLGEEARISDEGPMTFPFSMREPQQSPSLAVIFYKLTQ